MKAIRIHAYGGPEALKYEDVPVPVAGKGEALVKIAAIGVNFIDIYDRAGVYKAAPLPLTLGREAAGTGSFFRGGGGESKGGGRGGVPPALRPYSRIAVRPARELRQPSRHHR